MCSSASLSSIGLIMRSCQISDLPTSCELAALDLAKEWDGFRFQVIKDGTVARFYSRHGAEYADWAARW